MLEQVQIIQENNEARFAVIPYQEYLQLRELLSDEDRLEDYLDYLHIQRIKREDQTFHTLEEVKAEFELA